MNATLYKKLSRAVQSFHVYLPGQTFVNRPLELETPLEKDTGIFIYPSGTETVNRLTSTEDRKLKEIEGRAQKKRTTTKEFINEFYPLHEARKRGTIFFFTACGNLEAEPSTTKEEKTAAETLYEQVEYDADLRARTVLPQIHGGPGAEFRFEKAKRNNSAMTVPTETTYPLEFFAPSAYEQVYPGAKNTMLFSKLPFTMTQDKSFHVFTKQADGTYKPMQSVAENNYGILVDSIGIRELRSYLELGLPLYAENPKGEMIRVVLHPNPAYKILIPYTEEAYAAFLKSIKKKVTRPAPKTAKAKVARLRNLTLKRGRRPRKIRSYFQWKNRHFKRYRPKTQRRRRGKQQPFNSFKAWKMGRNMLFKSRTRRKKQ